MKNYIQDWNLSLTEYEAGGWGSVTGGFKVPAAYKKHYTKPLQGKDVYDKERAFNEIATLFAHQVFYRYRTILSQVDLFATGDILVTASPYNPKALTLKFRNAHDYYSVSGLFIKDGNSNLTFTHLATDTKLTWAPLSPIVRDPEGLTLTIAFAEPALPDLALGTDFIVNHPEMYAFLRFTRENVKSAIYKGIELASINREFWSLIKGSSFSGSNFALTDQTTKRGYNYELFINEANMYLESAGLNDYTVVDLGEGEQMLLYKGSEIAYGGIFNYETLVNASAFPEVDERSLQLIGLIANA